MIDMDLVSWSFCFYYIPQFTLGLVLLSSDGSDSQDLASDWSILEVREIFAIFVTFYKLCLLQNNRAKFQQDK